MAWYMTAVMKSLAAILEHIDTHKFLLLVYYIIKSVFQTIPVPTLALFSIAALSACSTTTGYQWLPLTKVMHYNVFIIMCLIIDLSMDAQKFPESKVTITLEMRVYLFLSVF